MEWRSTSLRLIGPVDGAQVEVVHHLADDVHRVVRAYRVQQRGREQERLVGCVRVVRSHAKRITRTILRLNRQAPSGWSGSFRWPAAASGRIRGWSKDGLGDGVSKVGKDMLTNF